MTETPTPTDETGDVTDAGTPAAAGTVDKSHNSFASRLYRGEISVRFIERRKLWYTISAVIILISLVSMIFRGFTWGIDFKGGDTYQFKSKGHSSSDAKRVLSENGINDGLVQTIGQGQLRIQTPPLSTEEQNKLTAALQKEFGITNADDLNPSSVGASWGSSITHKAVQGLIIFLIVVSIYISIRFEPKMAFAAMVALLHDLVITAGIYSLVGFEVTPSTIIALLTILGFSLYDTVVVFDRVRDNTMRLGSHSNVTFSEAANSAVNQTLMRSINTSLIALLPVAALLFIGAGLLGAGTLKDLALAQFVGLAAGAYSSIFIATPLLVDLKEREPKYQALTARVLRQRAARGTAPAPAGVAATVAATGGAGSPAAATDASAGGSAAKRPTGASRSNRPARRKGVRPSKTAKKRR
jgi:preprotein translocase subunit SecF